MRFMQGVSGGRGEGKKRDENRDLRRRSRRGNCFAGGFLRRGRIEDRERRERGRPPRGARARARNDLQGC